MSSTDFVTILGNVSQSFIPIQNLITGGAYLLGLLFVKLALNKLKTIGDRQEKPATFSALSYLFFGGLLFYIPTALTVFANTFFGAGNVLTYAPYNQETVYGAMQIIIRTAGLLWFVRGCVLVAQASEPGAQDGPKGLLFICSGVLAMNFDNTIAMANTAVNHLIDWSISIKQSQGF